MLPIIVARGGRPLDWDGNLRRGYRSKTGNCSNIQQPKPQQLDGEKSDKLPTDPNDGSKRHKSKEEAERKRQKKEKLAAAKSQQTKELQTGQVVQTEKSDQQVVQQQQQQQQQQGQGKPQEKWEETKKKAKS